MRKARCCAFWAAVWLTPTLALAQTPPGVGVRAGLSIDPDQFFFGGHVETRPLVDRLTFRPNAEIGVGDDFTLLTFNIEFAYWVPLRNRDWRLYFGGGPALVIAAGDGDDVGGGFNILVGAEARRRLFFEFKVGFADSPDVKFTVGYTFR